ncbi:DUF2938 domain-containing protein [Devriesea agamarum]|uniref:DUF2938 domain-containing protein n=1 Tax=Devriesea agamarum TaxID=472569 RepID=UPI00071D6BCE|nr:DUF2938 domain-containing protein [Devriesea agamarum]
MRLSQGQICQAIIVGVGATAVMDATAEVLRRTRGTRSLDYALVGRWLGHMKRGQFRHDSISAAQPVPHERALGWSAHYGIGASFAVTMAAIKPQLLDRPKLLPAVTMGLATLAAPWFLMQPAFGFGVAASKTPNPAQARLGSIRAHGAYGVGLWLSGIACTRAHRLISTPSPHRRAL